MSKKLHKAFSQITYQLCAWHYPWSISSVLDQVPHRSAMQVHVRPPTQAYTSIHKQSSPLAENTWANMSLSLFLFVRIYLSLSWSTLSMVIKAMAGTRPVKSQARVTFHPWLPPPRQTQLVLPVISKPVFGEASLSEQWENIQCISIGRLWFLFVLHLLCLAIVHRNDSRVHCINSQTTLFLLDFVGMLSVKC